MADGRLWTATELSVGTTLGIDAQNKCRLWTRGPWLLVTSWSFSTAMRARTSSRRYLRSRKKFHISPHPQHGSSTGGLRFAAPVSVTRHTTLWVKRFELWGVDEKRRPFASG